MAEVSAGVIGVGLLLGIPVMVTVVSFLKGFSVLGAVGTVFSLLMAVPLLALLSPEIGDAAIGAWLLVAVLYLVLGWAPIFGAARLARPGSWWFRTRYSFDEQTIAAVTYVRSGDDVPLANTLRPPGGSIYPETSRAAWSLGLGVVGMLGLFVLSPVAWLIGVREVKAIDQGRRSPGNRTTAKSGKILGMVGTGILLLVTLVGAASIWLATQEGVSHADSLLAQAHDASDPDEALSLVDELIDSYENSVEPDLQVSVAKAMTGRGIILENLGRFDEARQAHEEMVARFEDSPDPVIVGQVAVSMAGIGRSLENSDRHLEAVKAFEAVVERFAAETDPVVIGEVAHAMVGRALALENLGALEQALAAYEEMIDRFADNSDPGVQVNVAVAMTGRGIALALLGRNREAVTAWDNMISRFDITEEFDSPNAEEIDYQVATAYVWKISTLVKSGHREAAGSSWAAMGVRFSLNEDPAVDELLAEATSIMKDSG